MKRWKVQATLARNGFRYVPVYFFWKFNARRYVKELKWSFGPTEVNVTLEKL